MYSYFWYFFTFAFLGWCAEVAFAAIREGKFVNRGFLNGPVCPIYGLGVALIAWALKPVKDNFILLFLGAVVLTSALEWLTGFVLKKIFHHQWWDYSEMKFNIGGYICLEFSLIWGVAGMAVVKLLIPPVDFLIRILPRGVGIVFLIVFGTIMLADIVVTVVTIVGLNQKLKKLSLLAEKLRADSDRIGRRVFEESIELKEKYDALAEQNNILRSRLIKAFPNMRSEKYNEQLEKIKSKLKRK